VGGQLDVDSTWFPEDGYVVVSTEDATELWTQDLFRVPARTLPFNDIRKTINKYGTLGTFDEAQLETWNADLLEAQRDVEGQCSMCSDLRVAEAVTNQVIHHYYVDPYDCDTLFPPRAVIQC
jgi:hypothetical protein